MEAVKQPSFLQQLGQLARDVDQRTLQFQEQMLVNKDFCAPQALKTITDTRKQVKQTVVNLQSSLTSMGDDMAVLDEIIQLGTAIINKQKPVVAGIELHLKQYGYTPSNKADSTTEHLKHVEDTKLGDGKINGNGSPPRNPPCTRDVNRTPQLEDAGISQMTMDYLNSISRPKFHREVPVTNAVRPGHNTVRPGHDAARPGHDAAARQRLPSVFEHNGLICSPGLLGNIDCSVIDHAALASPVSPVLQTRNFAQEQKPPAAPTTITAKYEPLCSPVTPELLGHKLSHINIHGINIHGQQKTKRSVNMELFQDNPAVKSSGCLDAYGEPQEQDLTYSLEPLEDMTGMHMFMPRKDVHRELASPMDQISYSKENVTPTQPEEFLYSQHSNVKVEVGMTTPERKQPASLFLADTPVTPILYGNYDV